MLLIFQKAAESRPDRVHTLVVEQWTGCSWFFFYSVCIWCWCSLSQCLAWIFSYSSTPTIDFIITNIIQIVSMMAYLLTHNADPIHVTCLAFIKMLIMVFMPCFFYCAKLILNQWKMQHCHNYFNVLLQKHRIVRINLISFMFY